MTETPKPNYIRAWRKDRGLSLRRLAEMLSREAGEDDELSYVSIGRIERGIQPYTKRTLEAIAKALLTHPAALLWGEPHDVGRLMSYWQRFSRRQKAEALEALDAIDKMGRE